MTELFCFSPFRSIFTIRLRDDTTIDPKDNTQQLVIGMSNNPQPDKTLVVLIFKTVILG